MKFGKGYYNEITLIKFAATLFITWFHFKWTVPDSFASFFIGGAIGNSLFFFCSGYLVKMKEERFKGEWIFQKLTRILPSVWIFCAVTYMLGMRTYDWYNFIYPTDYWFVNAILCFFILFYVFYKVLSRYEKSTYVFVTLLYCLWYYFFVAHNQLVMDEGGGGVKCWFYYFLFFMYGYYDKSKVIKSSPFYVAGLIVSVGCFYGYKTLCNDYDFLIPFQFVFVPVLLFAVVYNFRRVAVFLARIPVNLKIKKVIIQISDLTLDIYVVQMLLIDYFMPTLTFPVNVIVVFMLILTVAFVNNRIAGRLSQAINSCSTKLCKR